MKVECPVCDRMGHLQVRGKSARVDHYVDYDGKTRIVQWHKVDAGNLNLVNNGNQNMVNNKSASPLFN